MDSVARAADFQARAAALADAKQSANPKARGRHKPSILVNAGYPGSIVFAFTLGLIAVLVSRYVRFHIGGGTLGGDGSDLILMIDGGLAAMVGFVIRQMFRFEAKVFITSHTVGVVAMIVGMQNLVHYSPEIFAMAFSPEWTNQVLAETPPNSVIFRDMVFTSEPVPVAGGSDYDTICGMETFGTLTDSDFARGMKEQYPHCFEN